MRTPGARRRTFFRYIARETLVWWEEMCGIRHVRLPDIAALPPEVFAALIPAVRPGVEIVPGAEHICALLPGETARIPLFAAGDTASLEVFNRFNRTNTIRRISVEIAASTACPADEAMARVRSLFLRLLELQVCVPYNIPEPPGRNSAPRGFSKQSG